MLTVIMILLGISGNMITGMAQQSKVMRARSELAAISQALTQYRMQYGDYIQTDKGTDLFEAFTGKMGPKRDKLTSVGRVFIGNLSRFTARDQPSLLSNNSNANELVDPWGNPYRYLYKMNADWANPSFLLYSDGPDSERQEQDIVTNKGYLRPEATAGKNADNIYEPAIQ